MMKRKICWLMMVMMLSRYRLLLLLLSLQPLNKDKLKAQMVV
jgi:hypothetical protein